MPVFPRVLCLCFTALCGSVALAVASPLDTLVQTMSASDDASLQLHVLRGMNTALKGKHDLPAPAGWEALYAHLKQSENKEIREQAQLLGAVFGGAEALRQLRQTLADSAAPAPARLSALESLASAKDIEALPSMLALLHDAGPLRRPALRGLAGYTDARVPEGILAAYAGLTNDEKRDALTELARRPATALVLLGAVDRGQVSRADLTVPFARQLQDLHDPAIDSWLKEHWGALRSSSAEKQAEIARLKAVVTPELVAKADANHGHALFAQTCALCHTLFGQGAKIGPELPGAFEDVDYLLLNIVDPNAIIGKDYQQTVVETKSGQTVVGIIGASDAGSVTVKTLAGPVLLQRPEIAKLTVLDTSLMPEGLLSAMKEQDVRDLFAYLRLHGPVPILLSDTNLSEFNEDPTFAKWTRSRASAWKAEQGELTGHGSPDGPELIASEFVADSYRLEMDVMFAGSGGSAELALRQGLGLRFAPEGVSLHDARGSDTKSSGLPDSGSWQHCAVTVRPSEIAVDLAGPSSQHHLVESWSDATSAARAALAFTLTGAQTELRVKNLRLQLLHGAAD